MPDKDFWHIIKNKLESLSLQPEDADWQLMSRDLDHPMDVSIRKQLKQHAAPLPSDAWDQFVEESSLTDSSIDQQVKQKLDDLEIPLDKDAWLLFQEARVTKETEEIQQPNHHAPVRRMELPLIDAIIRRKLAGLELSPLYSDWYDMLEMLEKDFDKQVRFSLASHEEASSTSDWKRMSLLLDQISKPVRTFPWVRTAAAAVVFFTLLIGGNFWMLKNDIPYSFTSWIKKSTSPTRLAPEANKALAAKRQHTPAASSNDLVSTEETDTLEAIPVEKLLLAEQSEPEAQIGTWDASNNLPIDLIKDKSLNSDSYQKAKTESKAAKNATDNAKEANSLRNSYQINKMGIMAVNELWEMQENEKPWLPSLGKRKINLWIGAYAATAQTKAELNGPKAGIPGYTAGVRAMLQLNERWSFVSGLAYGKKEFQYAYRFLSDSLAMKGSLTVIDMPLLLRYELKTENELKLYLQAGALATLSLNETYLDFDPNAPQNGGITSLSPYGNEPTTFKQKLNSYPGNIFLSFGLAYPVGDRLRIELEPYFLQNLQRVGGVERNSIKKRLYTAGIGLNLFFNPNPNQ